MILDFIDKVLTVFIEKKLFQWSPPDLYFLGQQIIPPSRSKIPPICFLFCFSLTPLYHGVSLCITVYNCAQLHQIPGNQLISTFQQPSFSELDAYHLENDKSAISICVLFLSNGNQDIAILQKIL